MKHLLSALLLLMLASCLNLHKKEDSSASSSESVSVSETEPILSAESRSESYDFPEFYKGIYLNVNTGRNNALLNDYIKKSRESGINTFVVDVQRGRRDTCEIPESHVRLMKDNGIHPVARIVCFDQGITRLPINPEKLERIYKITENTAKAGFKEIQFDYIRFADRSTTIIDGKSVKMSHVEKYDFIQNLLKTARARIKDYDVRIAADVFGRIPWLSAERHDTIGQKMENFDKVCDVILPMAYPSHYWNDRANGKNYIALPYKTVFKTSVMAREKTERALIVSWIQAFQLKIKPSGLTYAQYIEEQIRACHDAEIEGFIMWNARQDYRVPFEVMKSYYSVETD
ncbi:MAG: hypothetical protein PF637_08210 [Spirochaetes bacterium]|jgi:hypothetical protein|nr:hypothetical protein [Spirochaetota bacterium]